jgi:hypothetical protein
MEIVLALVADAANTTDDGKLNLLGVFQTIAAPEVPACHALFYIVFKVRAGSEEKGTDHTFSIQLKDADLRSVCELEDRPFSIPTDTKMPFAEIGIIIAMHSLIFPVFGHYLFQILIDGTKEGEIDLLVQPILASSEEQEE